ncbi:MAG TPA: hypothetical protein ENI31_03140 [Candidatus Omnitrophica bacterium]|nr:MAG: hypothetical protein DRP61_04005 [Candidatus Omnitrophota bacterium]RKY35249.1 MAG: hypothetical protein DRP69_02180 [Candidatus Omnitrophota bacterium]RKY43884.1 MAG: hypothetical protein DRP80_03970 [Candidatus Omnitrophota bacterium]HEC69265.1 hypothetical protein [Candidatus Omnitrophota bacterium]
MLKRKAQSIVEYTLIASVVVAAMILVASALKSKLTTHYKEKAEATVDKAVNSMDVGVFSTEE